LQKRVVAISDISCLGKCSLTVALPIISAAGIETAVIPTAVLSTHTGGFKNYTFKDSVEMNSRIKKDDNNYKYVIRLKDELKDHKELLELIYREEEVES
jgi:pyridoxal/pyridoxine/pyridoxamine kinase